MSYSLLEAICELNEEKTGYRYKNLYIIYGKNNSHDWFIKDSNSDWTYSGNFSTDKEAEEFIDEHEDKLFNQMKIDIA